MFYSHTYLARKGPLGTVWCAAHLQHKLKKSHYASTDIPSTVDRIMCPEVPIALRMSGHLLLGIVRIYSKKVDYLHHDCNALWVSLRNAFRPLDINLPENASHAQFNAVTLPETYELDALDIEAGLSLDDGVCDNHLRSQEEITLKDQYPAERELYVRITFDYDNIPNSSRAEPSPRVEIDQMEIDSPQVPGPGCSTDRDPCLSNQSEEHGRFEEGSTLPDIPELMRDYDDNDNTILRLDNEVIPLELETSPRTITTENENDTSSAKFTSAPQVQSPQSLQRSGPSSPTTDGATMVSDSYVNIIPDDLQLRPTPPPEEPQRRQRRKRPLIDEALVLTNEFVKNALNDCSGLVKKRKKLPCTTLDMWRFRNNKKKEHVFSEPLIFGLCADLENLLSSENLAFLNPNMLVSREAQPELRAEDSPAPVPNVGVEAERLRSPDHDPGHNFEPVLMPSSPQQFTPPHSQGTAKNSSASLGVLGSVSEPLVGATIDTTSDRGISTSSHGLGMETPIMSFDERIDDFGSALSDIPELRNSVDADDLSFLEKDNENPPESQRPCDSDTMSVRARAVAKYLKNHSPLSTFSNGPPDELSLNSILEGRSRKLCARMFYETLVLKDRKLIDVRQDEPYGDIILKLTPKLSATEI